MMTMLRIAAILCVFAMPSLGREPDAPAKLRLFEWEKGIAVESGLQKDMNVFLWFYEWNMFHARREGVHTSGTYALQREVGKDGQQAVIRASDMTLTMKVDGDAVDLTLEIKNRTKHNWPAIAGIIPCFNPGAPVPQAKRFPIARLNPQFDNRNTWYVGSKGLAKLDKREIHFNSALRKEIDGAAKDDSYPFTFKWPTSPDNAHAGLMLRESTDGKWVTGIAWEYFLSAQGHNPWQCMHLCINVGPLKPGESKTIRGRIYLQKGTKEGLYQRFRTDFTFNSR